MITLSPDSRQAVVRIKNIKKLTLAGIEHAWYTSGIGLIKATSKEILRKPKSGITYLIRNKAGRTRRHVASAPGETHADLTGALRKSLSFKVKKHQLEFGYGITKNDAPDYANIEFGRTGVAARPSLRNGIKDQSRNIEINFKREFGKRLGDRIK